jgi:hypothetical protein
MKDKNTPKNYEVTGFTNGGHVLDCPQYLIHPKFISNISHLVLLGIYFKLFISRINPSIPRPTLHYTLVPFDSQSPPAANSFRF